jgi:hypothetical protein
MSLRPRKTTECNLCLSYLFYKSIYKIEIKNRTTSGIYILKYFSLGHLPPALSLSLLKTGLLPPLLQASPQIKSGGREPALPEPKRLWQCRLPVKNGKNQHKPVLNWLMLILSLSGGNPRREAYYPLYRRKPAFFKKAEPPTPPGWS